LKGVACSAESRLGGSGRAGAVLPTARSPQAPLPCCLSPHWQWQGARRLSGCRKARVRTRPRQAGIRDDEGRQVNRPRPLGSTLGRRPSGWQLLARPSRTIPSDHGNLPRVRARGRRNLSSATCDTAIYSDLLHVAGRGILTVFGAHSRSHPAGFPRAATMAKRHAPWHSLVLAWVRHRGSHVALLGLTTGSTKDLTGSYQQSFPRRSRMGMEWELRAEA